MYILTPVPPALLPLVGCALALCTLWIGWRTLRTLAIPPWLKPLLQLNALLVEAMLPEAARRRETAAPTAGAIRVYGWAAIYAGTFALIIVGGQLVRLMAHSLGA